MTAVAQDERRPRLTGFPVSLFGHSVTGKTMKTNAPATPAGRLFQVTEGGHR